MFLFSYLLALFSGALLILALILDRKRHPLFWRGRSSQKEYWRSIYPDQMAQVEHILRALAESHQIRVKYLWSFQPDDCFQEIIRAHRGQLSMPLDTCEIFIESLEEISGQDLADTLLLGNMTLGEIVDVTLS